MCVIGFSEVKKNNKEDEIFEEINSHFPTTEETQNTDPKSS